MPPDVGGWADTPWWARASVVFVAPTLITGYLIWVLVQSIHQGQTTIMTNQTQILTNQMSILEMLNAQARSGTTMSGQLDQIEMVLTQICANASKTTMERTACFDR